MNGPWEPEGEALWVFACGSWRSLPSTPSLGFDARDRPCPFGARHMWIVAPMWCSMWSVSNTTMAWRRRLVGTEVCQSETDLHEVQKTLFFKAGEAPGLRARWDASAGSDDRRERTAPISLKHGWGYQLEGGKIDEDGKLWHETLLNALTVMVLKLGEGAFIKEVQCRALSKQVCQIRYALLCKKYRHPFRCSFFWGQLLQTGPHIEKDLLCPTHMHQGTPGERNPTQIL